MKFLLSRYDLAICSSSDGGTGVDVGAGVSVGGAAGVEVGAIVEVGATVAVGVALTAVVALLVAGRAVAVVAEEADSTGRLLLDDLVSEKTPTSNIPRNTPPTPSPMGALAFHPIRKKFVHSLSAGGRDFTCKAL
jgi:hypothetical protein